MSTLVIAPHPDDETLGCGGTILKKVANNEDVTWLIVTAILEEQGFSKSRIEERNQEIESVAKALGVTRVVNLGFPTATLETVARGDLIQKIADVVREVRPNDIFLPFRRDAHSDHAMVFDAGAAVSKWFRYESVQRVYCYETLSETDFDISPDSPGFKPNVFVDISTYFEKKWEIASIFKSEFSPHPFPRSERAVRALALVRGAASGFEYAEAFMLLRERQK